MKLWNICAAAKQWQVQQCNTQGAVKEGWTSDFSGAVLQAQGGKSKIVGPN